MPESKLQSATLLPKRATVPWANASELGGQLPAPNAAGRLIYTGGGVGFEGGVDLAGYAKRDSYLAYRDVILASAIELVARRAATVHGTGVDRPTSVQLKPASVLKRRAIQVPANVAEISVKLRSAWAPSAGIFKAGTLAISAEGVAGFRLWDIASGEVATVVGHYDQAPVTAAVIVGTYAYVLSGQYLQKIDISTPAAPAFVSQAALDAQVSGADTLIAQGIYVTALQTATANFEAFNVAEFGSLTYVSALQSTVGLAAGVEYQQVNGTYHHLLATATSTTVSLSQLLDGTLIGSVDLAPTQILAITVAGAKLYVLTTGALYEYNCSNTALALSKTISLTSGSYATLAVSDNYVVVCDPGATEATVSLFSLANFLQVSIDTIQLAQERTPMVATDSCAALATTGGIKILQLGAVIKLLSTGDDATNAPIRRSSITLDGAGDDGLGHIGASASFYSSSVDYVAGLVKCAVIPSTSARLVYATWDHLAYLASDQPGLTQTEAGTVRHVDNNLVPQDALTADLDLYSRDLILYSVLAQADTLFQQLVDGQLKVDAILPALTLTPAPTDGWSLALGAATAKTVLDSTRWCRETFRDPDAGLADRDNLIAYYVATLSNQLSSYNNTLSELLALCTEAGDDLMIEALNDQTPDPTPPGAVDEGSMLLPDDKLENAGQTQVILTEQPFWEYHNIGDWAPIRTALKVQLTAIDTATTTRLLANTASVALYGKVSGSLVPAIQTVFDGWSATQVNVDSGSNTGTTTVGLLELFYLNVGTTGIGNPAWTASLVALESALAASTATWKIVVTDYPVFASSGVTGAPGIPAIQVDFAAMGAALVLSGGALAYERLSKLGFNYANVGTAMAGGETFGPSSSDWSVFRLDGVKTAVKLRASAELLRLEAYHLTDLGNQYLADSLNIWLDPAKKVLVGVETPVAITSGWAWRDVEYTVNADGTFLPACYQRDFVELIKASNTATQAVFASVAGDLLEYDKQLKTVTWKPGGRVVTGPVPLAPKVNGSRPGSTIAFLSNVEKMPDVEAWRQKSTVLPSPCHERPVYFSGDFGAGVLANPAGASRPQVFDLTHLVAGYPVTLPVAQTGTRRQWFQICAVVEPLVTWPIELASYSVADSIGSITTNADGTLTLPAVSPANTPSNPLNSPKVAWNLTLPVGSYMVNVTWSDAAYDAARKKVAQIRWNGGIVWGNSLTLGEVVAPIVTAVSSSATFSITIDRPANAAGLTITGVSFRRLDLPATTDYTAILKFDDATVQDQITFSAAPGVPQAICSRWFDTTTLGATSLATITLAGAPGMLLAARLFEVKTSLRISIFSALASYSYTRKKCLEEVQGIMENAWKAFIGYTGTAGMAWTLEATQSWNSALAVFEPRLLGAFRPCRAGDLGRPALVPAGLSFSLANTLTNGLTGKEQSPALAPWEPWMAPYGFLVAREDFWRCEVPPLPASIYVVDPTGEDIDYSVEGAPLLDFSLLLNSGYVPLL